MNFNDQFASLNICLKKNWHSFRESFVMQVKTENRYLEAGTEFVSVFMIVA